jgi:hypothetical protein
LHRPSGIYTHLSGDGRFSVELDDRPIPCLFALPCDELALALEVHQAPIPGGSVMTGCLSGRNEFSVPLFSIYESFCAP